MNVLYGLYQADEGEILLDDVVQHFAGPGDAMNAGIGMVHQHFMLVPVFTVAENVMLGHEETTFGGRARPAGRRARRSREISPRFGFDVDPDAIVEELPVGVQQRVEIIKALSREAKVLVFDEPTAVLTPQETDELMAIMRQLRDAGTAIVFITHKLREVREVADRITVIRLGKVVGEASPTASNAELASLMVGRSVELTVQKEPAEARRRRPRRRGPHGHRRDRAGRRRRRLVRGAGAARSWRSPACRATARPSSPRRSWACRIACKGPDPSRRPRHPGARACAACSTPASASCPRTAPKTASSASSPSPRTSCSTARTAGPFVKRGWLKLVELAQFATEKITEFDIRSQGITTPVGRLSGGNQQKVVLARELSRDLRLFVAAQPTRGIDVGSIEFVHKRIVATRDEGVPVIVVSTELDEVTALADRIAVMYRGAIIGIVPADTPRDVLGLMMAGEMPPEAQQQHEKEQLA